MALQDFGRSVNQGNRLCYLNHIGTPEFLYLPMALKMDRKKAGWNKQNQVNEDYHFPQIGSFLLKNLQKNQYCKIFWLAQNMLCITVFWPFFPTKSISSFYIHNSWNYLVSSPKCFDKPWFYEFLILIQIFILDCKSE